MMGKSNKITVPLNDLNLRIQENKAELLSLFENFLNSGNFILGPEVEKFEKEFASYLGAKYCVGVGNGTDAIELSLRCLGLNNKNQIATVSNAGMYSSTAISAIGAQPIYMDVDESNYCVTVSEIKRVIDLGVNAIIITHLYGNMIGNLEEIKEICNKNSVFLIEDCAQAHGASVNGNFAGVFGNVSSFSFYPTKNLGGLGDGGAIVTNDSSVAIKARELRQYGWGQKYIINSHGGKNSRLDEIQAVALRYFLKKLDLNNQRRIMIADRYSKSLSNPNIIVPKYKKGSYVAHLYVIRSNNRGDLQRHLSINNIGSSVHYPLPDHLQTINSQNKKTNILPVTEKLANEIITIPCYPELTDIQVEHVINAINKWCL